MECLEITCNIRHDAGPQRIKLQLVSPNSNSAKPALILSAHYCAQCMTDVCVYVCVRESHMLRVIQIERRPDRSMHALLAYRCTQVAYGPVCICAHVVSNRYRGYRQTGGEINTHRRASAATTTSTRASTHVTHTHVDNIYRTYRTYISARQRRDRGFAEMALVSRYVNSVTQVCIRGVPHCHHPILR